MKDKRKLTVLPEVLPKPTRVEATSSKSSSSSPRARTLLRLAYFGALSAAGVAAACGGGTVTPGTDGGGGGGTDASNDYDATWASDPLPTPLVCKSLEGTEFSAHYIDPSAGDGGVDAAVDGSDAGDAGGGADAAPVPPLDAGVTDTVELTFKSPASAGTVHLGTPIVNGGTLVDSWDDGANGYLVLRFDGPSTILDLVIPFTCDEGTSRMNVTIEKGDDGSLTVNGAPTY